MTRLDKDDLAQMGRDYFQSLDNGRLVEVATNLHQLAVEQWERLAQNSQNSSCPPSTDSPYHKGKGTAENDGAKDQSGDQKKDTKETPEEVAEAGPADPESEVKSEGQVSRSAGKQPGAPGKWRMQELKAEVIVPHFPEKCLACNATLSSSDTQKPYMGYYVLELERGGTNLWGIRVECSLHHYYEAGCACGHVTREKPGTGAISVAEGRKRQLQLQEQVLVGPMLATFLASLANRYRMSRVKICEFLKDWFNVELSVGTIDRCVREAGFACHPVVEELLQDLQQEEIVHLDETPWYERGTFKYLWVAVTATMAIFHVGSRKKEELLHLITEAFVGWLVTDGYMAYRSHKWRQRCLAHLIRKAIGISEGVDPEAGKTGEWLLKELRRLIKTMADGGEEARIKCNPILARLKRACLIGEKTDHSKLKALAAEILNDWDAVVAFVKNPGLPPTNNLAERMLRHAVILRRITFGTRTSEGSLAFADLLSVIETCRLRGVDPWDYIASVIANGRKGLPHPPIPSAA